MTVISKLQQYNYTKENINHIINYLETKTIPPKLNARQRYEKQVSKNGKVKPKRCIHVYRKKCRAKRVPKIPSKSKILLYEMIVGSRR